MFPYIPFNPLLRKPRSGWQNIDDSPPAWWLWITGKIAFVAASFNSRKRQVARPGDPGANPGQLASSPSVPTSASASIPPSVSPERLTSFQAKSILIASDTQLAQHYFIEEKVTILDEGIHIPNMVICSGRRLPTARFPMLTVQEDTTFGSIVIFGKSLGQFCQEHPRRVCELLRERYKNYAVTRKALVETAPATQDMDSDLDLV